MVTVQRTPRQCEIDDVVERLESAIRRDSTLTLRDVVPTGGPTDDPELWTELLCADMEFRWLCGDRPTVQDYENQLGETIPAEVAHQLTVQVSRWMQARPKYGQPQDQASSARGIHGIGDPTTVASPALSEGVDAQFVTRTLGAVAQALDSAGRLPEVGETIGPFRLCEILGEGAFGAVYLARQADLEDRRVVVKCTSVGTPEVSHLARLQHAHIVPIYSVHRFENRWVLCMPYYGRDTFATRLARASVHPLASLESTGAQPTSGPTRPGIDESTIVERIHEVAQGLAHAHRLGILHRDIKPANILWTDEGRAMLLDFNLSTDMSPSAQWAAGVGGTLPYLAPEHLLSLTGGQPIGPEADLYSLGVVFFEMLTGRRPFPDRRGSWYEMLTMAVRDRQNVPSLSPLVMRGVSSGTRAIVSKLLQPDRVSRYHTAEELLEDLGRQMQDRPLRYAIERDVRARIGKWIRRHPRLTSASSVAVLGIAVCGLLAGGYAWRGHQLAIASARSLVHELDDRLPEIRTLTTVPWVDPTQLREGLDLAQSVLNRVPMDRQHEPDVSLLSAAERVELYRRMTELQWEIGLTQSTLARIASDESLRATHLRLAQEAMAIATRWATRAGLDADSLPVLATSATPERLDGQSVVITGDVLRESSNVSNESQSISMSTWSAEAESGHETANVPDDRTLSSDILQARYWMQRHEYDRAQPYLERWRSQRPLDVSAWFLLGNAQAGRGAWRDAESSYSIVVALRPDAVMGWFHRGLCRLDMDLAAEAEADFQQVLTLRPNWSPAHLHQARAFQRQAEWDKAEAASTQALQGAPSTAGYLLRAEIRAQRGDLVGARTDREAAKQLTPTDEYGFVSRGLARLRTDLAGAEADFQAALRLSPRSHAAWRNLAFIYAEQRGKTEESLAILANLIDWYGGRREDVLSRGVLHARLGQRDDAHQDARRIAAASPTSKEMFQLGCLYALTMNHAADDAARQADLHHAVAWIDRAMTLDPRWLMFAKRDGDLQSLRENQSFKEIIAQAEARKVRDEMIGE